MEVGKMSMGGGSSGVTPVRSSSRPSVSTGSGYMPPARAAEPEEQAPAAAYQRPAAEAADPELPTYVGVGGGLSNRRIVTKLPQELNGQTPGENSLVQIIKYAISPEVATSDADQTVVEDVRERIELPDCRLLINNPAGLGQAYNLGKEHLQDRLAGYLVQKAQRTGTGEVKVNFCDIAVVTHDEGGHMPVGIDYLCR